MIKPVVSFNEAKAYVVRNPVNSIFIEVTSDYYSSKVEQTFESATFAYKRVNIDQFEILDNWQLKSPSTLQKLIEVLGLLLERHKAIFIFDCLDLRACKNAAQFDASARFYTVLCALGFTNISIIHDATVSTAEVLNCIQKQDPLLHNKQPIKSLTQVRQLSHQTHLLKYRQLFTLIEEGRGNYHLVDARSEPEFLGLDTGYPYIELAGKIPTAVHISSRDFEAREQEPNQELLGRLEQAFHANDIGKADRIIWYCGTSWRASRMFVLTLAMGYRNAFVYDGGWFEWQRNNIL